VSWVRYDDGFDSNAKVTAVIAEDPGAISLHVLANTWAARSKRPGFVPTHQPGVLVGRTRGKRWAALLEKHGLLDPVDGGWEFHDHSEYRENGRRTTAGTPAEVAAKRRAAGSKGGKAAQQAKQKAKQAAQQNEQVATANEQPADSPVGTTELRSSVPPVPVPTTSGDAEQVSSGQLVAEYIRSCSTRPPKQVLDHLGKVIKQMLAEEINPAHIRAGLVKFREKALHPSTLPALVNEVMNAPTSLRRRPTAGVYDDADEAWMR
jgi:hypothetical protein